MVQVKAFMLQQVHFLGPVAGLSPPVLNSLQFPLQAQLWQLPGHLSKSPAEIYTHQVCLQTLPQNVYKVSLQLSPHSLFSVGVAACPGMVGINVFSAAITSFHSRGEG